MATQTITAAGSGTFTVPANVYSLQIEVWGAAGGSAGYTNDGGGGAGAGAYSRKNALSVTPGLILSYINGSPGVGGTNTSAPGTAGGDTAVSVSGTTVVLAKGGQGGSASGAVAASGGQASQGIGDVKYSGGNGGTNSASAPYFGGGGGAAGPDGNGVSGASATTGLGGAGDAGLGGVGGTPANLPGAANPKGGGGGAAQANQAGAGGAPGGAPAGMTTGLNGTAGQIIFTWTPVVAGSPKPTVCIVT